MTRRQSLFAALLMAVTLQMAAPARAQAEVDAPAAGAACMVQSSGLPAAGCEAEVAIDAGRLSPEPDPAVLLLAAAAVIAMQLMRRRRRDAA